MKVIKVQSLIDTDRHVKCPNGGFESIRPLLEKDGMGFSLHITYVHKGDSQRWHYKHHLEACYCISGRAILRNEETGESFVIVPGTLYALDENDSHSLKAWEDTVLVSVFNPPVIGREVHQADGSYQKGELV